MNKSFNCFFLLFPILAIAGSVSCQDVITINIEPESKEIFKPVITFSDISLDSLSVLCNQSSYRGKSIGVFGGSYTIASDWFIL